MDWARRLENLDVRRLAGDRSLYVASSRASRLRGLAGLDAIPPDRALLLPCCRSVHTFGMRFALDLVWLDEAGTPRRVDHQVSPRRLRTCLTASSVVEVGAGAGDEWARLVDAQTAG